MHQSGTQMQAIHMCGQTSLMLVQSFFSSVIWYDTEKIPDGNSNQRNCVREIFSFILIPWDTILLTVSNILSLVKQSMSSRKSSPEVCRKLSCNRRDAMREMAWEMGRCPYSCLYAATSAPVPHPCRCHFPQSLQVNVPGSKICFAVSSMRRVPAKDVEQQRRTSCQRHE